MLGSVIRCGTDRHLTVPFDHRVGEPYPLTFEPRGEPAPFRASDGGPRGLLLDVAHVYEIVESERVRRRRTWRFTTKMYEYYLLDRDGAELLAYHWQPGPVFEGPDHPQVHVSAALTAQIDARRSETIDLDRRHVVTGRVSLAAFVRMLIEEFQVAPRRGDWRQLLDRADAILAEEAVTTPD